MAHEAPSVHDTHAFFRRIHQDHLTLREMLASLDHALGRAAEGRDAEDNALELLGDLELRLIEHFDHEEQGGFVANALRVAPRLSRRAAGLFDEHRVLKGLLHRVTESTRLPHISWDATRAHYRRFLDVLREHERIETEVIQEALLDDLGGGG